MGSCEGGGGVGAGGGTLASTILRKSSGDAAPGVHAGGNGGSEGVVGSMGVHFHPAASVSAAMLSSARAITLPVPSNLSRASNGGSETQRGGVGGGNLSAPRPDPGVLKRKRPDMEQGVLILGTGGHFAAKGSSKAPALGDRGVAVRSAGTASRGGGGGGEDDGSSNNSGDRGGESGEEFFRIKLSETQSVNVPRIISALGDMTPDDFLTKLLRERGYDSRRSPALEVEHYRKRPTEKMVTDYDMHCVQSVRDCDLEKITKLHSEGRDMNACNKVTLFEI